ncbi:MAG: Pterin-4-alpha-carbinolamine dehydratase, partial [uncultured Nocardioidaceae bacterium]
DFTSSSQRLLRPGPRRLAGDPQRCRGQLRVRVVRRGGPVRRRRGGALRRAGPPRLDRPSLPGSRAPGVDDALPQRADRPGRQARARHQRAGGGPRLLEPPEGQHGPGDRAGRDGRCRGTSVLADRSRLRSRAHRGGARGDGAHRSRRHRSRHVVPADERAAHAAQPLPPRRRGALRRGRATGGGHGGRWGAAGQRRPRPGVLGAGRRRGERGVHLHLAGPRQL